MSIPLPATGSRPSTHIPPDRLANLILTSKTAVAAAELLPFPYLNGALGPVIPILEAVQKMAKNREDFAELCASIVEIVTLLQVEISRHGADAASRLTQFCEQLKLLLQEIEKTIGNLQDPKRKGFRSRFKELGGLQALGMRSINIKAVFTSSNRISYTADTIQAGLKNIALTRSVGSDHQDATVWLASSPTEWLLIFDNVDDLKLNLFNFFPRSTCGNILITSRNPQLRLHVPAAHHRISDLEQETAVQLLLSCAAEPPTSENEMLATDIVKALHCFPLAVVQAGAYILKTRSLRRYLSLYEQNQARLLREVSVQSHDEYTWSVYTTWDISFKCLSKPAARFMQLCSFLHHEGISEGIFSNAAIYCPHLLGPTEQQMKEPQEFLSHFLTANGVWDTLRFVNMAVEVEGYSLMNKDPNTGLFSVHPLVHSWSRKTVLEIDGVHECTATLLAMSVSWEDKLFTMSLLPHINTILQVDSQLATEFLLPYQWVYYDSGNFQKAQELCEDLVERVQATLGAEHPDTLTAMANLASTYWKQGKLTDAEELEVVVLEKRRGNLGPDHPDTLLAMGNLADIYHDRGKLTESEELEVVVLEKRKQILGPEHPHTLTAMAHLASTYRSLGKFTDAEELEVIVLEKRRQTLGPKHPHTLTAMANLAATYRSLGQLTDPEELEVFALEKRRQTLGPEHPHTLLAMVNLARTDWKQGKLTDGEELEAVVLKNRRQILGSNHPVTLIAMENLGSAYHSSGKLTDAEQLQVVVLENRRTTLGSEHPDTLRVMANLAHTYGDLGKLTDAEELEVVVLEKTTQTLGPEHLDTLISMGNLAYTYRDLGKLRDAEELEVVPWQILAATYRALEKLTDAEELGLVVLDKRRKTLGPEHSHTLLAMAGLASTYRSLGKPTNAEELEVPVLEQWKKFSGPINPATLKAMQNMAATYHDLGKSTMAKHLFSVIVEARTHSLGPMHSVTVSAQHDLLHCQNVVGNTTVE
ncbi:hypothetical protein C8J57DRAFT_1658270 [Mycena rebaudengoi]|nr:hypothetical protein C8J57DRAFT_1658270 [Mycena rebaudengoi]